jgi:hypothetical protein
LKGSHPEEIAEKFDTFIDAFSKRVGALRTQHAKHLAKQLPTSSSRAKKVDKDDSSMLVETLKATYN